MKILFFMESYWRGGVDTFVINLINNWPNDADDLILICNENHSGIDFINKQIYRPCLIIKHKIKIFTGFFHGKRKNNISGFLIKTSLKLSSPVLRYAFLIYNIFSFKKLLLKDNPDKLMIINGGYPGGDSCRAAAISWGLFSKKSYSIHNFHGIAVGSTWHIKFQEYLVDIFISRFTSMFVGVSQSCIEQLTSRKILSNRNRIIHIFNGVEPPRPENEFNNTKLKLLLNIPDSSQICLMLGGYSCNNNFNKGHNFLFNSFKRVICQIPTAYLVICGHGQPKDIEKVNQIALRLKIKNNVRLLNFRNDISVFLNCADILLISSQVFESFCLAGIEAMAHRIPVVATKVGGIPEIIIDGEGGYCVKKDDLETYSLRVINLLENNKLREEQGEKGFQRFNKIFTASRMAGEYEKLIKSN